MKTKLLVSYLICCWLFASLTNANAQTPVVDSIRKIIQTSKNESQKLAAILNYCDQYQSLNRDTAYDYALVALRLAKQTNDVRSKARAELALANSYYLWGWVDSAGAVCDSALKKYNAGDPRTRDVYFKLLRQKAMCYGGVEKFPEALDVLYKLLREAEQYKDSITLASSCNTIGSVNILMQKPDEALKWITRALLYDTKQEEFIPVKATILTNAANSYMVKGSYDSAMYYIDRSVPLSREAQNLNTLATALRIRSRLYSSFHKNNEAEKDLREMLSIRRMLNGGSHSAITDDNIQLANFYANSGQLQKAIAFCKENLKKGDIYSTSDSVSFSSHLATRLDYYQALAGFYKQAGMLSEYTTTLEQIIDSKDSLYTANSAQAIAEVQTKYETEQKEKTILQQKYDLTKKNFIIFGSLALLLLSGIIFYLLFREYRRRQTIKLALAVQREQSLKETAVKDAEEKERKRIAADLHDNLGVQANAILYNAELLKNDSESSEVLVDGLHDTAKQMLLNLRETLWAMKATDIAAEELWVRIISFSKQMSRHYNRIQFSAQGIAPQHMNLSSAKALNVVMMIQEAVQNAIRHSGADKITIASMIEHNEWQIMVQDNGRGFVFEEAFAKRDSHGLKNIKERATTSGFAVAINSEDEAGTSVKLTILNP